MCYHSALFVNSLYFKSMDEATGSSLCFYGSNDTNKISKLLTGEETVNFEASLYFHSLSSL